MFYRQFLKIIEVLDEGFVKEFDFWLATLPGNEANTITVSVIASRFDVSYSVAETIVKFAANEEIIEKCYVVLCGNDECRFYYGVYDKDSFMKLLNKDVYCHHCDQEFTITENNVYIAYKRIKKPNVPEQVIKDEIFRRLGFSQENLKKNDGNFSQADSLGNHLDDIYGLFYCPDESAYEELKELRSKLDDEYPNTTLKGQAYEKLALCLLKNIKTFDGTNKLKTYTNQFDCVIKCPVTSLYLSIFNKLTPFVVIECKNEKTTPSNTYFRKLSDILATNDAQTGIVFSRKTPSKEDMQIAHEQYLVNRNLPKQRYLLSISDDDLEAIIEKKINLLEYLDYKFIELTTNGKNATADMFGKEKKDTP